MEGSYSFTSPEGEQIAVSYTADENGYFPRVNLIFFKVSQKNVFFPGAQYSPCSAEGAGASEESQQYLILLFILSLWFVMDIE